MGSYFIFKYEIYFIFYLFYNIVVVYGILIFIISLIPYFATWVALYPKSVPAQVMFGLLFVLTNLLYTLSTYLIIRANPYNDKLQKIDLMSIKRYIPLIIIFIGYILTFTVYTYGIFVSCMVATIYWLLMAIKAKFDIESSERFEALFDAIVAIVLTIIVLEIPMAVTGSFSALFEVKMEFIAYAVSFIVCFNYWNYNNNLFSIVNKINGKVMWSIAMSMLILSLIPYLSTFVAENFYSFVSQVCYGLDFIIVALLSIITSNALKEVDPGNIALLMVLETNKQYLSTIIIVAIGMVIGYFAYPPAIIISCLVSILWIWIRRFIGA